MPKVTRSKTDKVIHPYSRKALQIERKLNHDKRLLKTKSERSTKLDVLADKLKWFHDQLDDRVSYSKSELIELVQKFIHRFDDEFEQIAIVRSVGVRKDKRQHAPREAAIRITMEVEKNEFSSVGIEVPDLTNKENLLNFKNWKGEIKFVQNFKMRKVSVRDCDKVASKSTGSDCESESTSLSLADKSQKEITISITKDRDAH